MKAVIINEHGGRDKLVYTTDFPVPDIAADEVLVNVAATSVNRIDMVVRNGYPGLTIPLPHIPGGDIAGTVAKVGADVKEFAVGDRVLAWSIVTPETEEQNPDAFLSESWQYFGMHRKGSYAEYVAVPASSLVHLPESVRFEDAATLPIAGLTAYHAVYDVAKVQPGQTFMIWGGSGGFGTLAIQFAKAAGATVITTAGKDEKMQTLKDLGADYVFNHNTQDVGAEVRALFPGGVDCILDYVGPKTFATSFGLLRKGGKLLLCGMLTGRETTINIQLTYLRHISVLGLYLGRKSELESLLQLLVEKNIKLHIHKVLPLSEAALAHEIIESGENIGKIVLIP